jgi:hypothetical protein
MSWMLRLAGQRRVTSPTRMAKAALGSLRRRRRGRTRLTLEDLEDRTLPTLLGQQLFPSNYPWNQNISAAPVASNSAAVIAHIGPSIGIHPDWGTDSASNGSAPLYGIPYNVVHGDSTPLVNVVIDNYPGESDIVPVPIPANAVIEGDYQNGPNPNGAGYNPGQRGDSHLIIWDEDNDIAYELYGVSRPSDPTLFPNTNGVELPHTDGLWHAAQETVWYMSTDQFRTLGETSADAAGLSILAGLVRPDEGLPVSQGGQGAIDHALRFTLPEGDVSSQYIYPASHMVDASDAATALPLGSRLRLMNTPAIDAEIDAMGPEAQIIATAMQQYGLVLADIGSAMYVTGSSAAVNASNDISLTWDMNDVLGLEALTASDFQVINLTPIVTGLSESSGAAGTTITITGQNFSGAAGHLSVFFGTLAASTVTFVDDAQLTAVVPAGSGTVNVTVQSGVNETDTISDSPSANVNAPIFGYGTSATDSSDLFTFSAVLPATHLSASAPSSVAAGAMFSFTVTALDMNDGTASGFGGTVHFTGTDPLAMLPADYTFKPSDFGVHTFQMTAGRAGNQTFTVSDTPDGLGSAPVSVGVTPGTVSLSQSILAAGSSTVRAGQTLTVTLTARDAFGNQETGGGLTVAFALSGSAGGAFGPVTDNRNGTYTVVFTATAAGTGTITATINGQALTSRSPTLTVTPDAAPVIQPIGNITLPYNQFPHAATVNASSPVGNSLTMSVTTAGDSLLYDLQQQYQFQGTGYFTAGATAYVLHSSLSGPGVGGYYLLQPSDGALFAYDGSGSYAHTFSNGTPLATLGTNVYTDPSLLMNAQEPIDYTTLYNLEQQYHFAGVGYYTFGAPAYVLTAASNNTFGNPYYLLRSTDGALFAYDGSGSYAHSFANGAAIATLGPGVYINPKPLLNAQAAPALYTQLYQLNQQYDLQELDGSFYFDTYGHQAQWIYSPVLNQYGENWYTLTLSADGTQASLTAWQGYQDSAVGAVVATLPVSVYDNPALLTNATALPNPAVNATINNSGDLSIALPVSNYVGSFKLTVTASDGLLSTSQTILVTSTDTAPAITIKQGATTIQSGSNLTFTPGSFPQTFTVTATGAEGDSATIDPASVSSYSLAFTLQQQYRFQGIGYFASGAPAYVLSSAVTNSFGNSYYLIRPSDGAIFAYDGSGSYAHTFANVAPLATLGSNVYADPTLLLNAQPPVNYASLYTLQQQYQFTGVGYYTVGATAYVLHSNEPGAGAGGYYLLEPDGNLYAYDGSGSYAHTIANVVPLATLDPGVYVNPTLLLGAEVTPALYVQLLALEQQYDFKGLGTYTFGASAYVLQAVTNNANGNPYYLLNSNGGLYAYDGSGSYAHTFANNANLITTLDPSVANNPMLLLNAKAPVSAAGVSATLVDGTLTLSVPAAFVGTFQVTVAATDGILTGTQSFQVTSTDAAPAAAVTAPQTLALAHPTLNLVLGSADTEIDSVTSAT